MGYLGKISAVVTANTVDFSRNLNGAAADLKRFAGAVERDITRATNDANRAFSSMLTPLQRLERALQAASSMKLSFRGFAGAIRDIDGLKQRLATLKNSQVGLVVRASGMRSINEFRAAIEGIEGRSLDLAVRFGGLEQLRTIRSELANLSQQSVAAVTADPGGLARLKELQETVRSLAGDPLRLALRVGGAEALDKVEEQATGLSRKDLRLLMRIGGVEQLDRVVEELSGINTTSLNALIKVGGLAELDRAIEQFRNATPEQINAVINVLGTQDIEDATNRMRALYSASKQVFEPLAASVATFNGLGIEIQAAFMPALSAVQRQADALKSDIDSGVTVSEQRFNSLTNTATRTAEAIDRIGEASRMIAGYNAGTSFAFTQPEALAAINRAKKLQEDALKLSPQELRQGQFAFRSGVIAQELQVLAELQAKRESLALTNRRTVQTPYGPVTQKMGADEYAAAVAAADKAIDESLARLVKLEDGWEENLLAIVRNTNAIKDANAAAAQLEQTVGRIREEANFAITGQPQNIDQAQEQLRGVIGLLDQLDESQRQRLQGPINEAADLLQAGKLTEAAAAIERARQQAQDGITINANAAKAKQEIDSVRSRLDLIGEDIQFTITGRAQNVEQARQQLQSLLGDVQKLNLADRQQFEPDLQRLAQLAFAGSGQADLDEFRTRFDATRQRVASAGSPPTIPPPLTLSDIGLNAPLTDSTRQIGVLIGQVNSLESALEGLPISVRVGFVPALEDAKNELLALRNNADATAEEIAAAEARVRGEQGRVRNAVSVQGIRDQFGNFDEFINAGRIRAAGGELEALRVILGRVGAQASGPAVQAFNRFRDAVALSLENPGNAELSAAVDQARNEAITAASQIRGAGSQRRIRGQLQRAGDIQRFGADNISLALQQAAFAVDDFFSVQGDFSQRIRAVQNNLTQLAFILGGTTGLFIGLGVAIAAQAGVAIVKWINNGRTAEDQTKALNESLARQKTLVEELAGAFASLGDSIAERAFSEPAQQARAFQKQLQEIANQQRDLRRELLAGVSPFVQAERGNQNRIRRELENETDVARRLILERQLQESQRREQGAVQALGGRRGVPGGLAQQVVFEALLTAETAALGTFGPANEAERQAAEDRARQRARQVDPGRTVEARQAQRRALEEARSRLEPVADQSILGFGLIRTPVARLAASQLNEIEGLIRALENPLREALDNAAINLTVAGNESATQIEQAQNAVADAIRAGVPGARLVEQRLNSLGSQLERAFIDLEAAQRVTDVDERTRLQEQAGQRIADVARRQEAEVARADAIRRDQTLDPQRTLEARLQRAQQNLQGAGLADGQIARRLREIEFERETLRQQAQRLPNDPVFARAADQADAALRQEAAALEAATLAVNRFSEALNRASQEAQQNLQSAQQAADQARRDDLGSSTPQTREERVEADAALRRQVELERRAQVEIDNARGRLEQQAQNAPVLQQTFGRIREITEQLASGSLTADQQAALRQERASLQASIDQQIQLDPAVQAARDASTREEEQRKDAARRRETQRAFDEEVERRRNPRGDALRGLDLAETPGQRAARETEQGILDIDAAFREQGRRLVNDAGGLFDIDAAEQQLLDQNEAARQAAIRRFAADQQRAAAPAIFGLADSVANAVLQGPGRAALNVSDISTQEGARELNRLLRGEDSARDQNLIELQKQSTELAQVNTKLTALANRVGVAL